MAWDGWASEPALSDIVLAISFLIQEAVSPFRAFCFPSISYTEDCPSPPYNVWTSGHSSRGLSLCACFFWFDMYYDNKPTRIRNYSAFCLALI